MSTPVAELWLSLNDTSELALSIPLAKCQELSVNPLKWLRFLGHSIYGQEGNLSMSATGPPINNYTAAIAACAYYFISEDQPRLADFDAMDDRTSTSLELSFCRADFRERIIGRDRTCVCTGDIVAACTACHIIPHAKGDTYIANALNYQNESDELDGIDDIRNGLLLLNQFHHPFRDGSLAFLKTPTLYLSVDDIPYNPQSCNPRNPTSRTTLHYIITTRLGHTLPGFAPNNSDLREPADISQWPPATIINMSYTSAALRAWAPKSFQQTLQKMAKDTYYNDAPGGDVLDGSGVGPSGTGLSTPSAADAQTQRHNARDAKKGETPSEEMELMMHGVMALWMKSARQGHGNQQRTTASDLAHSHDRVKMWLDST